MAAYLRQQHVTQDQLDRLRRQTPRIGRVVWLELDIIEQQPNDAHRPEERIRRVVPQHRHGSGRLAR